MPIPRCGNATKPGQIVCYQTRTLHLLRIIRHRIPCENAGKFYGPINCCDWTTPIKQGGNDAQENSIRSGDQCCVPRAHRVEWHGAPIAVEECSKGSVGHCQLKQGWYPSCRGWRGGPVQRSPWHVPIGLPPLKRRGP